MQWDYVYASIYVLIRIHWSIETVALSDRENNDKDPLNLIASIAGEEAYQWIEAMDIEISALENRDTWFIVKRSHLPANAKNLPFNWDFKRRGHCMALCGNIIQDYVCK